MIDRSVAVIGSFRQHNQQVQEACATLRNAGVTVTSPQCAEILEKGIAFIRFVTDAADWSDTAIQALALHRIFRADVVYVVAPDGYIGRTTCYEVGRVVQVGKPIYFSARPLDLPLQISESTILDVNSLIANLANPSWQPAGLFEEGACLVSELERDLLSGKLRND